MYRGRRIVFKINEVQINLVWIGIVLAECIGLLDPLFFRSRCF